MEIGKKGLNLIKDFEGLRLEAYPDPATGGDPWTIGYGWTNPVDGKPVKKGMIITQQKAEELLTEGVKSYAKKVTDLVKVNLTQNQFDALVSFSYNLGTYNLQTSTLLKKVNSKDFKGASEEFLKWNKAKGKVMAGLTRRRQAEKDLFNS